MRALHRLLIAVRDCCGHHGGVTQDSGVTLVPRVACEAVFLCWFLKDLHT